LQPVELLGNIKLKSSGNGKRCGRCEEALSIHESVRAQPGLPCERDGVENSIQLLTPLDYARGGSVFLMLLPSPPKALGTSQQRHISPPSTEGIQGRVIIEGEVFPPAGIDGPLLHERHFPRLDESC
jgi:hypothetical protein